MPSVKPLHLLQITDTHLFADAQATMRGCPTAQTFQALLRRVEALAGSLDALLLTGDLSQDETAESYHRLQAMVAPLGLPTYWIPGNHDHLPTLEAQLQPPFSSEKAITLGTWTLLLLNTQKPGHVEGHLSRETLDWLSNQLQRAEHQHVLIAMHHPPCTIGSAWMDGLRLQNAAAFYQIIDAHPNVKGVVFGHIHQAFAGQRRGVAYLGSPSTCIQFQPQSPVLLMDTAGPGCRQLYLKADGHLETQVLWAD